MARLSQVRFLSPAGAAERRIARGRSPSKRRRTAPPVAVAVLVASIVGLASPQAAAQQQPPAAPTSVTVARSDGALVASWPAVAGATGYHVTFTDDNAASWQLAALNHPAVGNTVGGVASITISSADNAKTYVVGVRARNAAGGSLWQNSAPAGPWTPPPPPSPNVVVIVADDLGYNDVSFNGATDISTPNIDELADTGVTFTRGYVAAPICTPSRVGLLTGRYPLRSGAQVNWMYLPQDPADPLYGLSPKEKTLAAYLADAGYRTGAVGKWQVGFSDGLRPSDRGFDYYYGMLGGGHVFYGGNDPTSNHEYWYPLSEEVPYHWLLGSPHRRLVDYTDEQPYLTDALTDKAVQFVNAASSEERPWFLYLPYNAPHNPLQAPAALSQKYLDAGHDADRANYLAMVDSLDQNVGRVIDAIEDAGERSNTLIFFLSDNGGVGGNQDWADNGVLRQSKGSFYEGGIRVPFVASWPGRWPAGATYDKPVISLDIAATAMAAAGAAPDASLPLDGVDLDGYVRSLTAGDPHEALFWHYWRPGNNGNDSDYAAVSGDLKLVKHGSAGSVSLFNLASDPGEATDLFDETLTAPSQARTDAERLRGLWNTWNRDNLVGLYAGMYSYKDVPPWKRPADTREVRCRRADWPLMQVGTDFQTTSASPPTPAALAAARVSAMKPGSPPTLSVQPFGSATWDFLLPAGHTFQSIEVRWRASSSGDPDDWTGRSSRAFSSECVFSWQIPGLAMGTEYKAKVVVSATAGDGTLKHFESNTAIFTPPKPTLTVTAAGAASWAHTLPPHLRFDYAELRWRTNDSDNPHDWTGRSTQLFWDTSTSSWQIPGLTEGSEYKAKLFVGASDSGGTQHYLKSDTVVFTASG